WRSSPREGRTTRAALVVGHLLDDVALRQPCKVRVFRTAGPGGAVTKSACKHTGFAAVRDDVRQCAVVAGVPNRRNETITQLTPGVAGRAIWHANWLSIIDGRLVVGIVGRIGPSGRTVCGGCHPYREQATNDHRRE